MFVPIQALGGSDCHQREYCPASLRQAHLHATCAAGRTRRGTEAGPGRRGLSDHEPIFAAISREKQLSENIGNGRVGFWTRHRRASYPCFCWMPTVTSPKIHGQNRPVSTAAKKPTFNGQCLGELLRDHHLQAANTYFPFGTTLFGPLTNTQIDFACLPATVHVHSC